MRSFAIENRLHSMRFFFFLFVCLVANVSKTNMSNKGTDQKRTRLMKWSACCSRKKNLYNLFQKINTSMRTCFGSCCCPYVYVWLCYSYFGLAYFESSRQYNYLYFLSTTIPIHNFSFSLLFGCKFHWRTHTHITKYTMDKKVFR